MVHGAVEAKLELLEPRHAAAVLAFEKDNRSYFAASISDRGDAFFEEFAERFSVLMADHEAGECAYYVLVADGAVVGRFNLYDIEDGTAVLGYRVAKQATGRGLATAAVLELCALAARRHGIRVLRAATSESNVASQRVLLKAGFVAVGPAGPADLGGKTGTWFQREVQAAV